MKTIVLLINPDEAQDHLAFTITHNESIDALEASGQSTILESIEIEYMLNVASYDAVFIADIPEDLCPYLVRGENEIAMSYLDL